jgi:hypothetical protein
MCEDDEIINDLEKMYKTAFRIWLENGVWRRESIESILSRISDEEIVRLIREDRETDHGKNQKKEKGDNKEVDIS